MTDDMSTYKPEDHVKVEFADETSGESEWMWLEVEYSDDQARLVIGRLDSQPAVIPSLNLGQQLAISYDKIRAHQRFQKS
jgi:hypothetical protein